MRLRRAMGIVTLMVASMVGWRAAACTVFDDMSDRYSLGRYHVGSVYPELLTIASFSPCKAAVAGCLVTDGDGLVYGLWDADDRVEMRNPKVIGIVADKGFRGRLIANIDIGDSLEVVRHKLKSLPPDFPPFEKRVSGPDQDPANGSFYTITSCHIRGSNGATWNYILHFNSKAKLEGVVATDGDPDRGSVLSIFAIHPVAAYSEPSGNVDDFKDMEDRLALGRIPMGSPIGSTHASEEARQGCLGNYIKYSLRQSSIDCDFTDTDGVSYESWGNTTKDESFIVFSAQATASSGYRGQLIAGIKFGDSIMTVQRKLRNLPANFPAWTFSQRDGEGATLDSDYVIVSKHSSGWGYQLQFDLFGQLTSVSTGFDPNAD